MAELIKQRYPLSPEMQESLISGWLIGEGIEFIKKFNIADFPNYEDLYRALRAGKNAIEIANADIGYTFVDLTKIMDGYSPTMFQQTMQLAEENIFLDQALKKIRDRKDIKSLINELQSLESFGSVPMAEQNLVERLDAEFDFRRNEKVVKYGLPYLDELTGGLHRKELTTVAARPGVGKSSFALQVASLAPKWGEKALYFTLEMSVEQQLQRLMVQTGVTSVKELKKYVLTESMKQFLTKIDKDRALLFYEGVNDLNEICAAIQREKPYLAVIDQLTQVKVKGEKFKSRLEELQVITATLKKVSMSENVAIMLLCQINRDAANSEPSLANLKGSGQIEEDSDNVILIHCKDKNNEIKPKAQKNILLKLEKQRSGATSSYQIVFVPDRYKFFEVEENKHGDSTELPQAGEEEEDDVDF